jgi:hypothetical protein
MVRDKWIDTSPRFLAEALDGGEPRRCLCVAGMAPYMPVDMASLMPGLVIYINTSVSRRSGSASP